MTFYSSSSSSSLCPVTGITFVPFVNYKEFSLGCFSVWWPPPPSPTDVFLFGQLAPMIAHRVNASKVRKERKKKEWMPWFLSLLAVVFEYFRQLSKNSLNRCTSSQLVSIRFFKTTFVLFEKSSIKIEYYSDWNNESDTKQTHISKRALTIICMCTTHCIHKPYICTKIWVSMADPLNSCQVKNGLKSQNRTNEAITCQKQNDKINGHKHAHEHASVCRW